jgi:CheY-like chemotaxis protein
MARAPVVAVFNTSTDIIDLLRFAFERAGFVTVSAMASEIREGEIDLERFVHQHRPDLLVYDIAPPYEENWRLFRHLQGTPILQGLPIVLTTTNARHVAELTAGTIDVHEVVGKPYDLSEIVEATIKALPVELRPGD